MKKRAWFDLMLAGWMMSEGGVVQSIHPWLSEQSRLDEPNLTGSWHAAKNNAVAFFRGSPFRVAWLAVGFCSPAGWANPPYLPNLGGLGVLGEIHPNASSFVPSAQFAVGFPGCSALPSAAL